LAAAERHVRWAALEAFLGDTTACQGGTAILFDGDLQHDEDFFVALYD